MFIWSVSVDVKETTFYMFTSYAFIRCLFLSEHQNGTGIYYKRWKEISVSLFAITLMNRELTISDNPSDIRAWFTFRLNNLDLQRCSMLKYFKEAAGICLQCNPCAWLSTLSEKFPAGALLLNDFFPWIQIHLAGMCHSYCVPPGNSKGGGELLLDLHCL